MSLHGWLAGSVSLRSFRDRVLGVQAYAGLGLATDAVRILDWQGLARLLGAGPEVDLVGAGKTKPYAGALDVDAVRALLAAGTAIRVRGADAIDDELRALAAAFAKEVVGVATVQLWAAPTGSTGLGWRRQGSDVFFAQTAGAQEHRFRPSPERRGSARELLPTHECILEAGDWLYVPRGWWHRTCAIQDSLAMTVEIARPWPMRGRSPFSAPSSTFGSSMPTGRPGSPPNVVRAWCGDGYRVSSAVEVEVAVRRGAAAESYRAPLRLLHPYELHRS